MQPRYRLTGRLETGELAELYVGLRDERERVVIKLFHPRTSDDRYARALAGTTRQLGGIEDPGLLRVRDVGLAKGRLAVVREYVDGFTLGQALQRLTTREVLLAPPLALYVVIQLLEAVQRAHEAGVVHGAITPGNIVVGRDGRVAVADFGVLSALGAVPALRSFAARGRGSYRAPEVAKGDAPTPASDVYSLGAIAYELLTLREAVTSVRAVSTRQSDALPPPSRQDRRINARLDPIILRALEASPQRRYKTCAEFVGALRNFLAATGGMPGRADLARLTGELFPNEVQLQPSPQVPFTEPFVLTEVSGAHLASDGESERSAVLVPRPSFSGGAIPAISDDVPSGAETIEALPAFAAYLGPPGADEGTAPGGAGPLEKGWEAPPGEVPRPKLVPAGGAARGRLRVVEDFAAEPTRAPTKAATPPRPARANVPPTAPTVQSPRVEVSPLPSETSSPAPPVKVPDGKKRKMITEELRLWRAGLKRRRFLAVAISVAAIGLVCFGLVVYRFGRPPAAVPGATSGEPAPAGTSAGGDAAPASAPRAAPSQQPVRIEPEPVPVREAAAASARGDAAYLTITSNVPAYVYIDGRKVRGQTPLRRYRVAPGERKIEVVSIRTGERKTFSVSFEKGQERKVREVFEQRRR